MLIALTQALSLAGAVFASAHIPGDLRARQIDSGQLSAAYDYIVVGGGQSGLVIANRLSEDPTKTVLVVEYGYFDDSPAQLEPSSATQYLSKNLFNASSVAQPGLGNRQGIVYAASVVGGGSTVNGMLFDRGSADDYNNWEKLGNPGWGFSGLLPYFKKSATFTPPRADLAAEFNITWDIPSAWGDGPIQATFPDWQWPTIKAQWAAWTDLGVPINAEGAGGDAFGAYWVPSNTDQNYRRSYARNAYFDPAKNRPNLKLLIGYRVNEVLFTANKRADSIKIQARGTANGAPTITVKAAQEIILCAGWMHTPQILQRSGIGPSALLTQAGIPVLVDLPGVGSNLQDHPAIGINYRYQTDILPNQASLYTNATFQAWAAQQWAQRKGPSSMGVGNALATVPFPLLSPTYQTTIDKAKAQNAASYLPRTYTTENINGFIAQRALILDSFGRKDNGVVEIPFSGGGGTSLVLEKPLSRGTVLLNTADRYAEPIIDYNCNINPVDSDVLVATVKFARRWYQAPSQQRLTPVEQSPGTSISSDAQIASWAANGMTPSTAHGCGTAAMAPREQAGVVSANLTVYGVTGLSVGDISIIPIIPSTHPCATVYAIAEKAADLIKSRYDSSIPPAGSNPISTTTVISSTASSTTTSVSPTCTPVSKYGQCDGQNYSGCKICASGSTCQYSNPWYSQCL
ncbi:Dehydrogenase xptC [Psilocybe cubensis]|uniref:pyranose dehydrogenase (acceptor) n=2 Tax=Psilocybe cubensis TaxID=181762 RepID=A0A8H7XK74_PSICU|nr:Dehydrogenase xptC [Psilocybe cubensis]KAH9481915.1 Dehydrogenase xptC [Psilocybe cubensis]